MQLNNADMLVDTIKAAWSHPDSVFTWPENAKQFSAQMAVNIHHLAPGDSIIMRNYRVVPDWFIEKLAVGEYIQDYYHCTSADALWAGERPILRYGIAPSGSGTG